MRVTLTAGRETAQMTNVRTLRVLGEGFFYTEERPNGLISFHYHRFDAFERVVIEDVPAEWVKL